MLVCKKCGKEQFNEKEIQFAKRRHRHIEEENIPYYCGECFDNSTDEEYDRMLAEMNNPTFQKNVADVESALSKAISYDEWSGREFGVDRIDMSDTADNLVALGIVKDTNFANSILDEIETVVDKYATTIGSFFIKQKISEIRSRYK